MDELSSFSAVQTVDIEGNPARFGQTFRAELTDGGITAAELVIDRYQDPRRIIATEASAVISVDELEGPFHEIPSDTTDPVYRAVLICIGASWESVGFSPAVLLLARDIQPGDKEAINAIPVVGYSMTLDLTAVPDSALAARNPELAKGFSQLLDQGVTEIPAELWIDDQFHVVRYAHTVDNDGVAIAMEWTLDDFDVPFDIRLPDPSQIRPG
ncbi:hypothetical protein GIS00_18390 [Nakamurella sp. YIM 132087]|uniref:Uncharacterized protein n=1 Tax=Nakamurella alba TaxID=2665158 RepID=A0A7K1FP26_9ACTN|nr:hypothetical protein [Nakamurella alba]MTD15908.1 hypothetical protein [Nakamurella alba]